MRDSEILAGPVQLASDADHNRSRAPAPAGDDLGPLERTTETVILPLAGWPTMGIRDLWNYRDLIVQLTLRNVKVRYKQTILGVLWAVLQPVLMMLVFAYALRNLLAAGSGDVPFKLFVFSGLVPWIFFQTAVTSAANSVVGSETLVTKVYFPRLVIPLSAIAAALVDLAISFVVLLALAAWYRVVPGVTFVLVPAAVLLLAIAATGIGTLVAALAVSYRDIRHAVPFLLQAWMFATPTIFFDGKLGRLSQLNPLTAPIDLFRAATLGLPVPWPSVLAAAGVHLVLFAAGLIVFRRVEDSFADVI